MTILDPVVSISGVGEETAKKLRKLKIDTVGDLVNYWPRRYEDYSRISPVSSIVPGKVTLKVKFRGLKARYARRGFHVTEASAYDETGAVRVTWFNQPYRKDSMKFTEEYFLSGELELNNGFMGILNPSIERVSDFPANTARILPKYRETKGLTSGQIRRYLTAVHTIFDKLPESLPDWIVQEHDLLSYGVAREIIHFPRSIDDLSDAKRRLAFEEAFGLTLASQLTRAELQKEESVRISFSADATKQLVAALPFNLTGDQKRATWEILQDMTRPHPMNRLVEGDVGSGKTVVAAIAAANVISANHQVLLIAPTEILARQHFATMKKILAGILPPEKIQLLVGGQKANEKKQVKASAGEGTSSIVIGTHALLEDNVNLKSLGLVIIDEQHRFGVRQRQKLLAKAGHTPHLLSLTATPIPRSLALTVYGEMDVSIISEKPQGRLPIETKLATIDSRERLYESLRVHLDKGQQMYVIAPLIEESETIKHKNVTALHKELASKYLKGYKVGLLHGKLSAKEKDDVMQEFSVGNYDVLVSTTVIEVGVDVANATVIVIEGADSFGLAQLHQLRGRVGRSSLQSYCYLVPSASGTPSKRLRAMTASNDGFKLADLDLELRGPGQIYGTMQHGALDLRMVRLSDTKLLKSARDAAKEFISRKESLLKYEQLLQQIKKYQDLTYLN